MKLHSEHSDSKSDTRLIERHPVLVNLAVIIVVAILGILICYFSIAVFTKHGRSDVVPGVENMSYTQAVQTLHDHGFKVDIRDSLYKDDVKPGFVIEQFPKANSVVKPGRKIFLYINAVHPKEVVIDPDNNPREDALRSFSFRQGMARLEELGFKKIKVVHVLGDNDCIVKVTANGRTVKKTEKVPVNALIVVEVSDGRLGELRDSLQNAEYGHYSSGYYDGYSGYSGDDDPYGSSSSDYEPSYSEPDYSEPATDDDDDYNYLNQ